MLKQIVLMLAVAACLAMPSGARAADAGHGTAATPDTTHAGGAGGAGGHDAHAKPDLLPDPTSRTTQLQALWVLIIFIILLVILYRTAWGNVLAGLKKREARIRQDIADAEATRKRAEATLAQYN